MFDNIGGKIKALAKVYCWILIIASVILGIGALSSDEEMAGMGLLFLLVGPLVAWISSFTLYGFGELIERTAEIAKNTRKSNTTYRPVNWTCSCGYVNDVQAKFCTNCGTAKNK